MANIDDILKKSKSKIIQRGIQKKIKRDGPRRPWQEGLAELNASVESSNEVDIDSNQTTSEILISPSEQKFESNSHLINFPENKNKETLGETESDDMVSQFLVVDCPENLQQTYNEHTTNIQQTYNKEADTYNKPTSQPTTNLQHIPTTVVQQTYNKEADTYNKPTSQPTTNLQHIPTTVVQQNLQQTYNSKHAVTRLSGLGLNIMNSLFSISITNGSRITGPISIEGITSLAKINGKKTTQTVIYRLEKEGFLKRDSFKVGRGGWTSYEIPHEVYNQLLKLTTVVQQNLQQLHNKPTTQPTTQPTTHAPSKLVSNNINNNYLFNTEEKLTCEQLSKDTSWFKTLDFSPVSPIGAMQVNSSIRILVQEKLQPEQVQEFLNRFKNWLATQQKIQNPLAIFCDRLKEFATEGDSAILSVMTDQEREIEAQFIEETKKARAQIQLIEKAQIEKLKNQEESLRTEAEAEFEKWYNSASDVELAQMVPPIDIAPLRSGLHKISTKSAFMSKILLEKQK